MREQQFGFVSTSKVQVKEKCSSQRGQQDSIYSVTSSAGKLYSILSLSLPNFKEFVEVSAPVLPCHLQRKGCTEGPKGHSQVLHGHHGGGQEAAGEKEAGKRGRLSHIAESSNSVVPMCSGSCVGPRCA